MDTSDEFAYYLFRAGKFHAGHGPRQIHTPTAYITTSIGLVGATFARFMLKPILPAMWLPPRRPVGKNTCLCSQMMYLGCELARDYDDGDVAVPISLFGRMRSMVGQAQVTVHVNDGESVEAVLRKFFNYHPHARTFALERVWHSHEKRDSNWVELNPSYVPRPRGWRILLNGRNVTYGGGLDMPVHQEDTLSIFPQDGDHKPISRERRLDEHSFLCLYPDNLPRSSTSQRS
ncbi:MAG: hypothetical protein M5U34_24685 [Chloroflexi bacterium]|nr:hypothetical protein [Chloroflexota bacterium]